MTLGATAGLSSSGFGLRRFALLDKPAVAPASLDFATLQISRVAELPLSSGPPQDASISGASGESKADRVHSPRKDR